MKNEYHLLLAVFQRNYKEVFKIIRNILEMKLWGGPSYLIGSKVPMPDYLYTDEPVLLQTT